MRHHHVGAAPGTLLDQPVEAGRAPDVPAQVRFLHYDAEGLLTDETLPDVSTCRMPDPQATGVAWLHLQGHPSAAQLEALGKAFDLHPLALEDVFNRESRSKIESYSGRPFVVLSHVYRSLEGGLETCQISFFLGPNYLISINDGSQDPFDPVRKRIMTGTKIRQYAADYLLYALMDLIVDSGFPILDSIGERLDVLEDEVTDAPDQQARVRLHFLRRELVLMRRAWWPQRDVIATLMRNDDRLLSETTCLYLRDCHEHAVIAVDFVETYREMASSLLDIYLSAVSQRMNDIMKTLTIIATVFLPLMFITGLYGMNFDTSSPWNLPELHWRFGYLYALSVMAVIAVGMLIYFRRRRWL